MKILSIIIPCYNSEEFINKTFESIKDIKNYKVKVEVIIIDDGSNNDFYEHIKDYIDNEIFKYYYKTNSNWGGVINYVKNNHLANGQYITVLDSDDWYIPKKMEKVFEILEQKKHDFVIASFKKIFKLHQKRGNRQINIFGFRKKNIKHSRALSPINMPLGKFVSSSVFYKTNDLKEHVVFQDMILFLDILSKSKSIFHLPVAVAIWNRANENSSTNSHWTDKKIQIMLDNISFVEKNYVDKNHRGWCLYYYWYLISKKKRSRSLIQFNLKFNDFSLSWIPFGLRFIAKFFLFTWVKFLLKFKE